MLAETKVTYLIPKQEVVKSNVWEERTAGIQNAAI